MLELKRFDTVVIKGDGHSVGNNHIVLGGNNPSKSLTGIRSSAGSRAAAAARARGKEVKNRPMLEMVNDCLFSSRSGTSSLVGLLRL